MNSRLKKSLLCSALIFFALWPLLQFALVRSTGASPWKFSGWGMYCAPKRQVAARLLELRDGRPIAIDPERIPPPLAARIQYYELRRYALGGFLPPDDLARDALVSIPQLEGVVVLLRVGSLNRRSAQIESNVESFLYERETLLPRARNGRSPSPPSDARR